MKVAVAGAGVGGLCLAQGLLRAGLEVTVYERDQALDAGGQGYRLHLDAEPGAARLPAARSVRPLRRHQRAAGHGGDGRQQEPADAAAHRAGAAARPVGPRRPR